MKRKKAVVKCNCFFLHISFLFGIYKGLGNKGDEHNHGPEPGRSIDHCKYFTCCSYRKYDFISYSFFKIQLKEVNNFLVAGVKKAQESSFSIYYKFISK